MHQVAFAQQPREVVRAPPPSLIISPNLDALLEHDERTRRSSPCSAPPDVLTQLEGLSPPPRGPRKPRSPLGAPKSGRAHIATSPHIATAGVTTPEHDHAWVNPFINPPPSMEATPTSATSPASPAPRVTNCDDDLTHSHSIARTPTPSPSSPESMQPFIRSRRRTSSFAHRDVPTALKSALLAALPSHGPSGSTTSWPPLEHQPRIFSRLRAASATPERLFQDCGPTTSDAASRRHSTSGGSNVTLQNAGFTTTRPNRHPAGPELTKLLKTDPQPRPINPFLSHASNLCPSNPPSDPSHSGAGVMNRSTPIHTNYQHDGHSSRSSPSQEVFAEPQRPESFMDLDSPCSPDIDNRTMDYLQSRSLFGSENRESTHSDTSPTAAFPPSLQMSPPKGRSDIAAPASTSKRALSRTLESIFSISPISAVAAGSSSGDPSGNFDDRKLASFETPPPTTNHLNAQERAELVKKTRKLAKVFGQTPGASIYNHGHDESCLPPYLSLPSMAKATAGAPGHLRGASVSSGSPASWLRLEDLQHDYVSRRHSAPLSPDQLSVLSDRLSDESKRSTNAGEHSAEAGNQDFVPTRSLPSKISSDVPGSSASFMDFSEEDDAKADERASLTTAETSGSPLSSSLSFSTPSLILEHPAERERRAKREKLAKLHRFLGSHVPTDLVLGCDSSTEDTLPAPLPLQERDTNPMDGGGGDRKFLRRSRSKSIAAPGDFWSDDLERSRQELDGKEKAINVRRAQKMEKLFGVAPPQTLFHTRQMPPPGPDPASAAQISPYLTRSPTGSSRNVNQTAYKKVKNDRPSSPESSQGLLHEDRDQGISSHSENARTVYTNYQHSLISLISIIDRDDRKSLVELHQYLNGGVEDATLPEPTQVSEQATLASQPVKSIRRRSLPPQPSMTSLDSEYNAVSPKPELTEFQLRRRRAAKLTQFFGVDYRELIHDVLESIERGVEEERGRGTLQPDEVEDLIQKLRLLKIKKAEVL